VDQLAKPGEELTAGAVLARVHTREEACAEAAVARLRESVVIGEDFPDLGEIGPSSVD
jgi:predicted deacylase